MKCDYLKLFGVALAILSSGSLFSQNPRLKADLELFRVRCTQCHPIEMAKSETGLIPSDIADMIERMREQPGSLIQKNETGRLYQIALFRIYANQRADLEAELKDLSPEQRKKEILALKKALAPYK